MSVTSCVRCARLVVSPLRVGDVCSVHPLLFKDGLRIPYFLCQLVVAVVLRRLHAAVSWTMVRWHAALVLCWQRMLCRCW